MTQIVIYKNSDKLRGFKSAGHAGFGFRGNDVVCAAISVLLQNTVNSIEELTKNSCDVKINERKAMIEFWMDHPDADAQLLLRAMELGVTQIAKDYPGNVTIRIEEV